MKHPTTQALYAYWVSRCRGRSAPDRHDIDPAEMRGVLPHTFMLEVDRPTARFPIRLSGTRLDALFGRDLKNVAFADLWSPGHGMDMQALLGGVLDDTRPAVGALRGGPDGYAPIPLELLVLPLRHHGRTHARLLCSLVPAVTPSWIGLRPVTSVTVSTWRCIDSAVESVRAGVQRDDRRRGHLVVHEGGRAGDAETASSLQSRVKALMPVSRHMLLSTRRS